MGAEDVAKPALSRVLDLGNVPAADYFPLATDPVRTDEASHALAMDVCHACGSRNWRRRHRPDEPRGVEPRALKDQAEAAIDLVAAAGWLRGESVAEFGSPHGGTWIPMLTERGFTTASSQADVVLDCFGIMHEPNQRSAFARRAQTTAPGGVLLLQYHSIATIVGQRQWNALRHGHFAYYSLTTLTHLLDQVGMRIVTAWEFDLYGGTVLLAAVHGAVEPDESVQRILAVEDAIGHDRPGCLGRLQRSADQHVESLRPGSKRRRRPTAPSSRTVRRRGRSRSSAVPGSIRGYLRRSPTRRLPSKVGGCRGPTSPSCRRTNSRGEAGSSALDAARSLARAQRTYARTRRSMESRRPVTLLYVVPT